MPVRVMAFILICMFIAIAAPVGAEPRGFAVVVGINDYQSSGGDLPNLSYAEADARKIGEYLTSQKYDVRLLLGADRNATKPSIVRAVSDIATRIGEEDRFIFAFSGHGVVEERDGVKIGYLVAEGPSGDASKISAGEIQDIMLTLDVARHQLFIFASCYGGLLGQLPRRSEKTVYDSAVFLESELQRRKGRHYLSAGGEDQQVLDSGPAGLSWFTYFLLKGLEPEVVSNRENGLLTFTELATYVQAYSANPYHTPAFGTLAGDGGGQILLRTTDKGVPRLPALPTVSARTLADLGFLARGSQEAVRFDLADMRSPLDRLYLSWEQLDLDFYMSQFDKSVVQTGRYRNGETYSRGYDMIRENRRMLFPRLEQVNVRNYQVMFQGVENETATFGVVYSMDFRFKDGRLLQEHNVKECYKVRRGTDNIWRIVRNDDYQQRICS